MESETPVEKKEAEAGPTPAPRRFARRKKKLMIVAIVIVVGLVILFWGWDATGNRTYISVSAIVADHAAIANNTSAFLRTIIEVQGVVTLWSGGDNFSLTDTANATKSILVNMTGAFPSGFADGKTVVVKGTLASGPPVRLIATGITVGCSSKY